MMTGKSESKSDLPKSCKLAYPRSLVIENFANNYVLAAHPYPQIEGEMLLF